MTKQSIKHSELLIGTRWRGKGGELREITDRTETITEREIFRSVRFRVIDSQDNSRIGKFFQMPMDFFQKWAVANERA